MTQAPDKAPVVVKPQPNIYTLLLIIAIIALVIAIGAVIWNLTSSSGYGLSMGELLSPPPATLPVR